MANGRLQQIERLFQAAADLPKNRRAEYLKEHSGPDPKLRAQVEQLLARFDNAAVASLDAIEQLDDLEADCAGRQFGPYKLLRLIGEGGFAAVYLAQQEAPVRREVALKIIKLGMDTRQVIARFEAERQALAMMDHPSIAHVFDAGATDTGRPYFAMELVRGVPITEYCNENSLSTRERLELFSQVCRAVQHAHQKGVIHRDIKPSNVLVTLHDTTPVPKVIDFGIAKATSDRLTQKTLLTEFVQFIGTPQYMSPEQAAMSGMDVDTRTDVYSLGVLLYELLTDTTPFEAATLREAALSDVQRIVCDQVPPTPSRRLSTLGKALPTVAKARQIEPRALGKLIRGDLDWIVMKALEKDRRRRYETAASLAEDVERHLRNEPVLAGPPTLAYKLAKFVQRNRVGVATGVLFAVVLVIGSVAATIGFMRAKAEAKSAQAINAFFNDVLVSADPLQLRLLSAYAPSAPLSPGLTSGVARSESVTQMVRGASARVEETFAGKPELAATAYETIGMTLRGLGRYADAEPQLQAALRIRRQVLGDEHPDTLRSLLSLGDLRVAVGRPTEGVQQLRTAYQALQRILGEEHPRTLSCGALLAAALSDLGRLDESNALFARTLTTQRRVMGHEHRDALVTMCKWSVSCLAQGRISEGRDLTREVSEIAHRTLSPDDSVHVLAQPLTGWWHLVRGEFEKAELIFREGLANGRRILGDEHPLTYTTMRGLAHSLQGDDRQSEAEQLFRQALAGLRATRGDLHWRTLWAATDLAKHLDRQGRFDEAETVYRRLVGDCIRAAREQDVCVARNLSTAAEFLERAGKGDDALTVLRKRLQIVRERYGVQSELAQRGQGELEETLRRLGRADTGRDAATQTAASQD